MSNEKLPGRKPAPERYLKGESGEKNALTFIVEVGSGAAPLMFNPSADYSTQFNNTPSVHYIAVDLSEDRVKEARENMRVLGRSKERVHHIRANGEHLPFPNNSVSELILKNVLGGGTHRPKPILRESARVLKKGGILKIIETYEPWAATEALKYLRDELEHVFREVDGAEGKTPLDEKGLDTKIMASTVGSPDRFIKYFQKHTD